MITYTLNTCHLRPWREGDEESLARQASNRRIWNNVRDFFPYPYTIRDANAWVRSNKSYSQPNNFAIEVGGEAVGNVGFTVKDDIYRYNAEIGYWLGEPYWGRGIISEVLPVMIGYIFDRFQVNRLFACVLEGNTPSMRVLEKAHFRAEAVHRKAAVKNNQYLDEHIFALLREEYMALRADPANGQLTSASE
ncbi:GNAT family N-acetyltransferase [Rudanella paleaurantiibacter]|uniref:GNAT family N-acetyltransferase n=1 Tax=Rudanella paleaurantiibacter TaxID=2614655 RepID=A0A7J5U780_9BACT|nr:GNAT family N-acetyltransferase [Rudanella paleaurantiibacter]KAB7733010.1 GNAT family N-acetyltransferase [Rudanella paleaurantiibacter]